MPIPRFLLVLATSLLLMLASGAQAEAPTHTITLIQLNDLHANLVPHLDRVRVAGSEGEPSRVALEERGGMARLASLIQRIRASHPDSLLMNIADTYHGGVEALYTRGNAVAPALDALGIDIGVPGNWDFAYGALVTRLRYGAQPWALTRFLGGLMSDEPVARPNYPNLAANLSQTFPPFSAGDPLLPGTLILHAGEVAVGFIGLTADIVPRMAAPFAWSFDFLQGEDRYAS